MPYKFETLALHAGQERPDPATGARAVPIYASTAFVFPDADTAAARFALEEPGNLYGRLTNPTNEAFEKRVAAMEGGVGALSFASGMAAAAAAVQNIAAAGDHIVSDSRIYGGTYNLFQNTFSDMGISCTFVDGSDPANFAAAIRENTKCVFFETLGNPNCTVVDVDAVAAIAHAHGIPVIADNTFATPWLFRPFEHGIDITVHSASKFIGGHSHSIGGVVVDGGVFDWESEGAKFPGLCRPNPNYHGIVFTEACGRQAYLAKLRTTILRDLGATLSPFHSFLYILGLETLALRMDRHVENTMLVLDYLQGHPMVEKVNHPALPAHPDHTLYRKYFPRGAGSIFTFEIRGGGKEARKFSESLGMFSLVANVADMKSLVTHPASTTHNQMTEAEQLDGGILPGTLRLSIGCEHIDDIIADLEQGFKAVA